MVRITREIMNPYQLEFKVQGSKLRCPVKKKSHLGLPVYNFELSSCSCVLRGKTY